jgi:hypothetical protein
MENTRDVIEMLLKASLNRTGITPEVAKFLLGKDGPKWCCLVEFGTRRELAPRQRWDEEKNLELDAAQSCDHVVFGFFLEAEGGEMIWYM